MANAYANDFTTTVQLYYQDIKKYKPLSRKRETELIIKAKKDDKEATDLIIKSNLKFVVNVAKRYTGRGASIDDLISEGNLGLIKAIKKFDENADVKFISYAVWWIQHEILTFIQKAQIKANTEYYGEETLNGNSNPNSIYDEDYNDIVSKKETIQDDITYEEKENEHKEYIALLMKKLSPRERKILSQRFGLNGTKEMSLQEIGEEMNLSKERVRQILVKTLRKLRTEVLINKEFFKLI